jgi:CBS domain-containing membrane protein
LDRTLRLPTLCGIGLTIGIISATNHVLFVSSGMPLLITPVAASTTLVFLAPNEPSSRPWAVIAGSSIAAAIGVGCRLLIHDPILASIGCVVASLAAMSVFRCLHPPGAAVALSAVLGNEGVVRGGLGFAAFPIAFDAVLIVVVHRATTALGKRLFRYLPWLQGSQ